MPPRWSERCGALPPDLLAGRRALHRCLTETGRASCITAAITAPEIPLAHSAQLSAPVRPGEVLPRLNAGRFGFLWGGAAQHLQNQIRTRLGYARFSSGQSGPASSACEWERWTQDSYHMWLIKAAPTIAPQTAADAMLIRTTAARRPKHSSSPSSSKYAREVSAITIAGAILLNGTGVRSNAAVSNRITTPTKCLAASKAVGQRG